MNNDNLVLIATNTLTRIADAIREKANYGYQWNMTAANMPYEVNTIPLHGYVFENGEGGVAFNYGANLRAKFQNNTLRMYPVISDQVEDMQQAFNNCRNLIGSPVIADAVMYAYQAYRDCWKLTGEPKVNNWAYIPNVSQAFYNCINITGNANLPQTKDASYMYWNCSNLNGYLYGPDLPNMWHPMTAVNLRQAFYNCVNLKGNPIKAMPNPTIVVAADATTDMYQAYYNCQSLTGPPVIDNVTTDMTSLYENCFNITGRPVCAPNATIMNNTYQNCYNLTGPAAIGPKVTTAYNVYRNCKGITEAIMPNTVTRIDNGFTDCPNLGRAFLSTTCQVLYYIFNNCQNLTGSIIAGRETQYTQHCFYNCFKLQGVYIIGNDNTSSSIMNVSRSLNGFNRTAIDDPSKLSRLNVVISRRATMQKLAVASVTGCTMTAVEVLAADNKVVSLPMTYANGQVYGYKNYTCAACQKNEMYNLYFYSLN